MLRLSNRQAVLTHFALLHLLATAYAPSITPSSLIYHIRTVTSKVKCKLLGVDERERDLRDVEAGALDTMSHTTLPEDRWHHEKESTDPASPVPEQDARWFRIWDVSTDCKEIGNMECYGKLDFFR
jgi:hypothetical protein